MRAVFISTFVTRTKDTLSQFSQGFLIQLVQYHDVRFDLQQGRGITCREHGDARQLLGIRLDDDSRVVEWLAPATMASARSSATIMAPKNRGLRTSRRAMPWLTPSRRLA